MTLLITGGCGFIGSNFINNYFPTMGFTRLINLDAMYYAARAENVIQNIRSDARYVFVRGNVKDHKTVMDLLTEYNITHVIHFAAQSHVQNSFEDSLKFTDDNVFGTHTLLECCRQYKRIVKFIHVSTDEVYGESMTAPNELPKTEQSILCPTNPYAASKASAELIAQSYYHSYKFPVIITRGNNVYGPNQYPEKIIPLFIKQLNEGQKVTIQGDGQAVRSFLHAYDTATAFGLILDKGEIGEIYNIGCDEHMEYSVLDIAKILIRLMKNGADPSAYITYIPDRPFNDRRYYISNSKLKALGWQVTIDFITGIQQLLRKPPFNVLVYGAKGWIGSQFIQLLNQSQMHYASATGRADNAVDVATELATVKPTHVISFIGRTHGQNYSTIDYLEQKGKLYENLRDNLFAPIVLAEACQQAGIHYTYLGTGCIFNNDDTEHGAASGFTEAAAPNFFGSGYSTVKGFTDQLMQSRPVLNLRIRMPITGRIHVRNFITKITSYSHICSMANSMTVLPELLPLVLDMLCKGVTGTINLTNPGAITHNEILSMYQKLVPSFTWKNFTLEEQKQVLASERSNNVLDTTKLQTMYPGVKPIHRAVWDCLLSYVKEK